MDYLPRQVESTLVRAVGEFPAVVLTGPRQSGKTTLLRHLFGSSHGYISLDLPDVRAAAKLDPRGFLQHYRPPLILDEVQYVPELLPYLREAIDHERAACGRFVLSGSHNLLLMEKVSETLAGRTAVLRLLPLAWAELDHRDTAALPWECAAERPAELAGVSSSTDPWARIVRGGYPEVSLDPQRDARLWHASYLQTYLERDVRLLRNVGDLTQFQIFLRSLAARVGQLLNLTALARDLGIAVNTAKAWLSLLEACHQVVLVRPYFSNYGKRLVKTPKVYFLDTGTLCALVGLHDAEPARLGPMAGGLFENAAVVEILKRLTHHGKSPGLSFWRTSTGHEVDLLVEHAGSLVPIEIKATATPRAEMAAGIRILREALGDRLGPGYLIHGGTHRLPLGPALTAWPLLGM